jgi:hypothetical protein
MSDKSKVLEFVDEMKLSACTMDSLKGEVIIPTVWKLVRNRKLGVVKVSIEIRAPIVKEEQERKESPKELRIELEGGHQ